MHSQMSTEFVRSCKSLGAVGPCTDVGFFAGVSAHVGFEMVRSGEFSLADLALEWPDARVFSAVSPELIGS